MPGMPRQLQGWGTQTSVCLELESHSNSTLADSAGCLTWPHNATHPLGCRELIKDAPCTLQLSKGLLRTSNPQH